MNERIKDLLRECGGVLRDEDGTELPTYVLVGNATEQFAKLIIRECMIQIKVEHNLKSNGTQPIGPYACGFDDGVFVAIETIKQHFGAEE